MTTLKEQLDQLIRVDEEQIAFFRKNGFVKLKQVLSPELLAHYGEEISNKVLELNELAIPMEERDTYQKAFLQVMNLWRKSELVKEFVFGKKLAAIAAQLLGVDGVRLYHDQALYKEPSGGITPWHADQFYWPLSSEKTVTVWVPLQETPVEMGPLYFAAGSQNMTYGRDLPISDESEEKLQAALKEADYPVVEEKFDLGEVSYHYGWTYHGAGANKSKDPRKVMTVIYMDKDIRLKKPENANQQADWDAWCPGAKIGEVVATELNPILYEES